MDSSQLTSRQFDKLFADVHGHLQYFAAPRKRVEERGFPPDDKLRQRTIEGHDSLVALAMQLHYDAIEALMREDRKRGRK